MKTAIVILSVAAFALSAGAGTARADGTSGTLVATVDSITMAQAEGENSLIAVIDESGVTVRFDVLSEIAIYDASGELITLDSIKQNDTVEIEYYNLEGGLGVAKSIKQTNE